MTPAEIADNLDRARELVEGGQRLVLAVLDAGAGSYYEAVMCRDAIQAFEPAVESLESWFASHTTEETIALLQGAAAAQRSMA